MIGLRLKNVEATTDNVNKRAKRIKITLEDPERPLTGQYEVELSRNETRWLIGALKGALKLTKYKDI